MAATWLNIAATALAWIGAATLLFALFGDAVVQRVKRHRGTARERCPKCWYDLSHTVARVTCPRESKEEPERDGDSLGRDARATGLATAWPITCSECGRVVKRERHLYKGRKRWPLVHLALILFIAAHVLNVLPGIRQRGIIAAVPTTALIAAMPWLGSPEPMLIDDEVRGPITINNEFSQEFFERVYDCGRMWRWQERLIVERALRGDRKRRPLSKGWFEFYDGALNRIWDCVPEGEDDPPWLARAEALVEVHARTRPVWPAGVPIYAHFDLSRWMFYRDHVVMLRPRVDGMSDVQVIFEGDSDCGFRYFENDNLQFLGIPDPSVDAIEYESSIAELYFLTGTPGRVLRTQSLRIPIKLVDSVDDVLETVESAELTQCIASQLEPVLLGALTREDFILRLWRNLWFDLTDAPAELDELTLAFAIEALRNGVVVGEAHAWFVVNFGDGSEGDSPRQGSLWPLNNVRMDWFDRAEARFAEDAEWTLRLRSDPHTALRNFDSDRYWVGEIELPLRLDVWAER